MMSTFLAHYLGGLDLTENCHLGLKHLSLYLVRSRNFNHEFFCDFWVRKSWEIFLPRWRGSYFPTLFFLGTNVSVTSKNFQLSWTVNHALPRFGSKFCLLLEPFNPILLSNRTQFFFLGGYYTRKTFSLHYFSTSFRYFLPKKSYRWQLSLNE